MRRGTKLRKFGLVEAILVVADAQGMNEGNQNEARQPAEATVAFVIGVFRSGTSLLHRLVNAHPQVHLMWEADPLRFLDRRVRPGWAARLDLWNGCLTRHRIDPEGLPGHGSRNDAAHALYRAHAANVPAGIIGEKSPYYADILPRLGREFPDAKFVIIHRDPAATAASVREAARHNRFFRPSWMPLRVVKDAERLSRDASWLKRNHNSAFELSFEDLVADPDPVVRSIWSFLGVNPEPDEMEDSDASLLPPGKHHRNALHSSVNAERAEAPAPDPLVERHRLRQERRAGLPPRDHALLLQDELTYQSVRILESVKRFAFRNLPLRFLVRHRQRSEHEVS